MACSWSLDDLKAENMFRTVKFFIMFFNIIGHAVCSGEQARPDIETNMTCIVKKEKKLYDFVLMLLLQTQLRIVDDLRIIFGRELGLVLLKSATSTLCQTTKAIGSKNK